MEMSHAEPRLTFSGKSSFKIEMFFISRCRHDCNIRTTEDLPSFKCLLFGKCGPSTGMLDDAVLTQRIIHQPWRQVLKTF